MALIMLGTIGPCSGQQVTNNTLNCTQAQLECINAVSYELCITDATQECQTAFFLDEFASMSYTEMLFYYLADLYIYESASPIAVSTFLLPQTLSANDSFSEWVDALYGTNCSRDPSVLAVLVNSTETQATYGREWWLSLLRVADFCLPNQIYVIGMGCVCKENKDCSETGTQPFTSIVTAMIFLILVVFFFVLYRIYVYTRHSQSIGKEYRAMMAAIDQLLVYLNKLERVLMPRSEVAKTAPVQSQQNKILHKRPSPQTSESKPAHDAANQFGSH